MFDSAEIIAGLPHLPGVYRMLNEAGEVLYVGKALDLRKRVASYFQKAQNLSPRTQLMVSQVARIETTVTRSESEALLLENNLIKSLTPRYNILFRDDKSYPYLVVTGHEYPRLGFHRGLLDSRHRYYGPFPGASAVREGIQLMQKVFRIRTCEDTVFTNRSRPCLLHQIRRCTAPCVGLTGAEAYAEDVRHAELFLSGKEDEVEGRLAVRMQAASERMDYEQAALVRDQIAALRKVRETQFVADEAGRDADVVACAHAAGVICVNLVMVRGGHHLGDKNFFPRNAGDHSEAEVLEAFVAQHYLRHALPREIVIGARFDPGPVEEALQVQSGRKVQLTMNPTGARRVWLDMAGKNAHIGAEQQAGLHSTQETRLAALQQALELGDTLQRIECFDVSHTMGEAAVASCVVYDKAALQKSEYRRYNVKPAEGGDDYEAMREALTRRYRKIVTGEGRLPDLVLIDGGKGHLRVAVEVFEELGLDEMPIVAVAKGEERKPGLESLWTPGRTLPRHLAADDPALHLIQQIRDEAHRFAITGHRARRAKKRSVSPLEDIPGIGAKRRQKLLLSFGGMRGLLSASIDDLAQVGGISRSLAERIYQELH